VADVYVSSVAYAAIPAYQTNHAYSVGDIIRPTAATGTAQYPQRCTTSGTSGGTEPTWSNAQNGTTSTNGTVFTNVGGQSTYGWAAACGTVASISYQNAPSSKNISAGDRVFVSSDHTETNVASNYRMSNSANSLGSVNKIISVNRAGSVPPVAADEQSGAAISVNSTLTFDAMCTTYWQGFTFTQSSANAIQYNSNGRGQLTFKNCAIVISSSNSSVTHTTASGGRVIFDNTTLQFGHASQHIRCRYGFDFQWVNTASAIQGATLPTTLFLNDDTLAAQFVGAVRGVDLSALTGTIVGSQTSGGTYGTKMLFEGCKFNASSTRYGGSSSASPPNEDVEFVNCYDGTNIFSEKYSPAGTLTTDTTTYMTGGAADDVGSFSHKLVSTANCEYTYPFESFWLDIENTATGSSKTATVELVSSASLNNVDIKLILYYEGTSGSPVQSVVESSSVLSASSALASSSASWNSPPSTPVYQKLTVTFTPQHAGRVRAKIQLSKTSKTVWVNPQITLS